MSRPLARDLRILVPVLCSFALASCTQPEPKVVHSVAPPESGHRLGCQLCYDETVRGLTGSPKHRRYKTIMRHRCAECTTDVAFHVDDDGKLMIRCARCAPEGMPCDRCLPPMPSTMQSSPAPSARP